MHLNRFRGNPHRQIRGPHLGHRGLEPKAFRSAIYQMRDIVKPRLAHRQIDRQVSHQELVTLKIDNLMAGLLALIHVSDHVLKGCGRNTQGVGRDRRS